MITRAVPAIAGSGDPAAFDSTPGQGRVRPPEDVLRQARATSITGVLGQIANVASYAFEILQELKDETIESQDRMAKLHQRVDVLADVTISSSALERPAAFVQAYERCEGVPPLELVRLKRLHIA
ncbi:hypothetical protein PHYSODRAFT_489957 [Phytophthora sojae]|uniref:Uncharacterized protein n=1 Tax=Phytophthora sojae (strain P6497) TaxID=1094619 RepID=G4Z2T2_PHYSP|nr:hypothetical protein PHYSODRAFT_489957 [Phytophthora sojae]EGZ22207.1 hypothetical protein PHYSODRAFT_489957 [Phytophthora sojae]|eukprot:XP_009524924.1 hypothetical protein PHYSODRAFT_489957 [Phytophthora sojae]